MCLCVQCILVWVIRNVSELIFNCILLCPIWTYLEEYSDLFLCFSLIMSCYLMPSSELASPSWWSGRHLWLLLSCYKICCRDCCFDLFFSGFYNKGCSLFSCIELLRSLEAWSRLTVKEWSKSKQQRPRWLFGLRIDQTSEKHDPPFPIRRPKL